MIRKNPEACIEFARSIVSHFPKILPALDVIAEAESMADAWLKTTTVATSEKGHAVKMLSTSNYAGKSILLYGFADPGEAVGATGLLCLMKALKSQHPFLADLNLNWNFIPCLNLDDQPAGGGTLDKIMKTGRQEVDWLVRQPRPETTALLNLAASLKLSMVFPLHDEWHCHEKIPCYMPVSIEFPPHLCEGLRDILTSFGLEISQDVIDSEMGPGFLNMNKVIDFKESTFFEFSKHGTVFICEVPDLPGVADSEIIAAQLAAIVFLLANQF